VHWTILKSTGSSLAGFIRGGYTTLKEVDNRIFSTSVDLSYTFADVQLPAPADREQLQSDAPKDAGKGGMWDNAVPHCARELTMEVFAMDDRLVCLDSFRDSCMVAWEASQGPFSRLHRRLWITVSTLNSLHWRFWLFLSLISFLVSFTYQPSLADNIVQDGAAADRRARGD
jgi:hypothetical protein